MDIVEISFALAFYTVSMVWIIDRRIESIMLHMPSSTSLFILRINPSSKCVLHKNYNTSSKVVQMEAKIHACSHFPCKGNLNNANSS